MSTYWSVSQIDHIEFGLAIEMEHWSFFFVSRLVASIWRRSMSKSKIAWPLRLLECSESMLNRWLLKMNRIKSFKTSKKNPRIFVFSDQIRRNPKYRTFMFMKFGANSHYKFKPGVWIEHNIFNERHLFIKQKAKILYFIGSAKPTGYSVCKRSVSIWYICETSWIYTYV